MLRRTARVAAAMLAFSVFCAVPASAEPVELTILHTNDTHDHLEAFNTKNGQDLGGVARRKTLFVGVKDHTKNVLILDAGDVFQGTPLYTFFQGRPDFMAIKMLGYDALTVGNHDLDNGMDNLQAQSKLLDAPPLALNLVRTDGTPVFPGYRIVERGGLKVLLLGIMSDNAFEAVAEDKRRGLKLLDPVAEMNKLIPQFRDQVDLVVALSHSGHEEELAMAGKTPGLDIIIGGHSHTKVDHPVQVPNGDRQTLVVQAFQWGEYVGRMDLVVDHHRIQRYSGELLPVSHAIKPDPAVASMLANYSHQIDKQMAQVMGRSAVEFPNNDKAKGDAPIGNLISDAIREQTHTDIAFMNSGGIRAPFPKGDITMGDVYSVLPFENRLVTFKAKGQLMADIIGYVASKTGHQGSLQVSGMSLAVDHGKPVGVMIGGQPVDPNREYSLSTIDYIANGNDGADVFKRVLVKQPTGQLVRDAMFDYMKRHPLLQAPDTGRIKFLSTAE